METKGFGEPVKGERKNSDADCRSRRILGLHLAANTRQRPAKQGGKKRKNLHLYVACGWQGVLCYITFCVCVCE